MVEARRDFERASRWKDVLAIATGFRLKRISKRDIHRVLLDQDGGDPSTFNLGDFKDMLSESRGRVTSNGHQAEGG